MRGWPEMTQAWTARTADLGPGRQFANLRRSPGKSNVLASSVRSAMRAQAGAHRPHMPMRVCQFILPFHVSEPLRERPY
jgi:hypothetical protein